MGVVEVLVVVSASNPKAPNDSYFDSGVDVNERRDVRRCERTVVFPEPDSPL